MSVTFSQRIAITNKYGFKYNNTLYGLTLYDELSSMLTEEEKNKYNELNPFEFFITIKHDNLMITVRRIIKPMNDKLNNFIADLFYRKVDKTKKLTIVIVTVYLSIIGIWYLFIWKRIENKVVNSIYKSKHMVLLLPKELLVELNSLHRVFGINQTVQYGYA